MSYIAQPNYKGLNIVLSHTNASNNVAIIRVGFTSSGGAMSGEGASCSRVTTGTYNITWSTPFADSPVVVANAATTSSGINSLFIVMRNIGTTGCLLFVNNTSPSFVDSDFNLIAIGKI